MKSVFKKVTLVMAMGGIALSLTSIANAAYKTNGERHIAALAQCVGNNGKEKCQSKAIAACNAIKKEANNNAHTSSKNKKWRASAPRAQLENAAKRTANSAMRVFKYGKIC